MDMKVVKTTKRKAVSKAIAKQDIETQKASQQVQDAIRLKAYELYVQDGCQHGNDVANWQAAEQIVLGQLASK